MIIFFTFNGMYILEHTFCNVNSGMYFSIMYFLEYTFL